jgi:hypothetical protein
VRTYRYRITISGELSETGREVFSDFRIECHGTYTVLVGDLDQAAVFGTLHRIRALGLELLGLERLPERLD